MRFASLSYIASLNIPIQLQSSCISHIAYLRSVTAGMTLLIPTHSEGSIPKCRLTKLKHERDAKVMAECSFRPKLVAQLPWQISPKRAQPEIAAGVRMYSAAMEAHKMREERLRNIAKVGLIAGLQGFHLY